MKVLCGSALPWGLLLAAVAPVFTEDRQSRSGDTLPPPGLLAEGLPSERHHKRRSRLERHLHGHPSAGHAEREGQLSTPQQAMLLRQRVSSSRSTLDAEPVACMDEPKNWKSSTGVTCNQYREHKWCTKTGKGEGWDDSWGDFKEWANDLGDGADDACCVCGGGAEVLIHKTKVGEKCETGTAIVDDKLCRKAANSVGANYAMTANWPVGQPSGCHIDEVSKQVWFNTNPFGTQSAKFSSLCALEREDTTEDEEAEDEEAESSVEDESRKHQTAKEPAKLEENSTSPPAKLRGPVIAAQRALDTNLKRKVEIGIELQNLHEAASQKDIDRRVADVAEETKSPVMAHFLGDMWKEMRKYATPFYKEHLENEAAKLEKRTPRLEEKLKALKSEDGSS